MSSGNSSVLTRLLRPLVVIVAAMTMVTACQPSGNGTVSGVVTDTSGKPLTNCNMIPEITSRPRPPLNEQGYLTGSDGSYSITLPAATYTLTALCSETPGAEEVSTTELVVAEGEEEIIDFEIPISP